MAWWMIFLLLFACTEVNDSVNISKTDELEIIDELNNISNETEIIETEYIPVLMNFTEEMINVSDLPLEPEEVVVDLSISEQDKMIKLLKANIVNSSCYDLSWPGFAENQKASSLSVRKDVNFVYVSGSEFKGWVIYNLYSGKNKLASETVPVVVSNLSFSCNVSIWDDVSKFVYGR